jgi:ribosomal-protein-serine acetyltransferase
MINFDNYSIRLLELNDFEKYFLMVEKNRKRLEDFFTGTVSRTKTFEDTEVFLKELIQKREAKLYYPYIIENIENGEFVGFIDIKNIDWNIPKGELGCYTDQDYARKGITSKAFSLFVDYCFEHYGFNKLFLRTHETNFAAQKLADKAGFQIEGKIRKDYKTTKGELVDLIYYGRIKE